MPGGVGSPWPTRGSQVAASTSTSSNRSANRWAYSTASARSLAVISAKPPMISLASVNGPSVAAYVDMRSVR